MLKACFIAEFCSVSIVFEGVNDNLIKLDKPVWDGVILGYKIPIPEKPVDIYPYLE